MIDEVGLLPYSERLGVLKLTTLIERRTRGDLIEVFKSKKDLSNINSVLRFGRSGLNIISKSNGSGSAKLKTFKRNFINERVKSFWNQLPSAVKNSLSLNCFKSGLEDLKNKCVSPSDRIPLVGRRAQNFTSHFGLQCVQKFSFFVMFQQHFRSQQYIYPACRRRKFEV